MITMLPKIIDFFKHGSIYAVGNGINSILAFFLIPLYLRNLSVKEYGVYGLLMIVMQFVSRFGNLGIEASMMRSYYDYDNEKKQGEVFCTSTLMMLGSVSIIILLISLFSNIFSGLLLSTNQFSSLIIYSAIIGGLRALRLIPQGILRIKERSITYITLEILNFAFGLTVLIYFLEFLNLGLVGLIYGTVLSMGFNTIIFNAFVFKYYSIGFLFEEVTKQIKFGLPMVPAAASSLILIFSGRFFLEKFHGLELVGIFTLSYQLASMSETFIGQPVKLVWQPFYLDNFKNKNSKNLFSNIVDIVAILSVTISLLMAVLVEPLFHLFDKPSYFESIKYLPYLLIFISFWSLASLYGGGIIATRKTSFVMYNFMIGAVISYLLSWALIPEFMIIGAILSLGVAYFIMFTSIQLFNSYHRYEYVYWKKHWLIYFVGTIYIIITTFLYGNTGITNLTLRLLLLVSYPLTLYISGIISSKHFNQVKVLLKSKE